MGSKKSKLETPQICAICIQNMYNNIEFLPCAHCYHVACIDSWISTCREKNNPTTCPMCMSEF